MRCFVAVAFFVCLTFATGAASAYEVSFGPDTNGYGRNLVSAFLTPEELQVTELWVAQADVNQDGQPEFFVNIRNSDLCDVDGCSIHLYMLLDGAWRTILGTRSNTITVINDTRYGPMLPLKTSDDSVWHWNGTIYDIVPE